MKTLVNLLLLAGTCLVTSSLCSYATTYHWSGAVDTDWFNGGNWNKGTDADPWPRSGDTPRLGAHATLNPTIWPHYNGDNNDSFSDGVSSGLNRGEWIHALKQAYGKKPALLLCPTATQLREQSDSGETVFLGDLSQAGGEWYGGPRTASTIAFDDLSPENPKGLLPHSYGANMFIYNLPSGVTKLRGWPAEWFWRKTSAPPRPTETPLMADAMWRGAGPNCGGVGAGKFTGPLPPSYNGEWGGLDHEMKHFAIVRHGKGSELVFFDGSVRHIRVKEHWRLYWHRNYNFPAADLIKFPAWMPN